VIKGQLLYFASLKIGLISMGQQIAIPAIVI
jgi:hypothetical protein